MTNRIESQNLERNHDSSDVGPSLQYNRVAMTWLMAEVLSELQDKTNWNQNLERNHYSSDVGSTLQYNIVAMTGLMAEDQFCRFFDSSRIIIQSISMQTSAAILHCWQHSTVNKTRVIICTNYQLSWHYLVLFRLCSLSYFTWHIISPRVNCAQLNEWLSSDFITPLSYHCRL